MARNHMRQMKLEDSVLIYHSSVVPPGVAGLARVAALSHVDESQFDRKSPYYDPKATRDKPRWDCVDVAFAEAFGSFVTLELIRAQKACADMVLLRQPRLSVQPVPAAAYRRIVALGRKP
jgi:predicted RNA-binding protein with PUA-like domain